MIAAGIPTDTLARYMGTSVREIEKTYGHLLKDSADLVRSRANDDLRRARAKKRRLRLADVRAGADGRSRRFEFRPGAGQLAWAAFRKSRDAGALARSEIVAKMDRNGIAGLSR